MNWLSREGNGGDEVAQLTLSNRAETITTATEIATVTVKASAEADTAVIAETLIAGTIDTVSPTLENNAATAETVITVDKDKAEYIIALRERVPVAPFLQEIERIREANLHE